MVCVAVMLLSGLSGQARAGALSSSDSIQAQSLGEVMVTANRYSEVIPSQKLAGKELQALNSFSVADAIRYFSGIQIKDYGGVGGLRFFVFFLGAVTQTRGLSWFWSVQYLRHCSFTASKSQLIIIFLLQCAVFALYRQSESCLI